MILAAATLVKLEGLSLNDVGINLKKPKVQFLIMFTGIPFGIIEYLILKPAPVAVGWSTLNLVFLAIGFVVATGFVEEFLFRGVFQNNAINVLGEKMGLLSVAVVFAILHIGWLSVLDVFFVFMIGLFFGFVVLKTKSIAGVSLSHGLTNVFLFLVMPSSINLISLVAPK
jgi:membrane protease YdiL (CAAX protease family)